MGLRFLGWQVWQVYVVFSLVLGWVAPAYSDLTQNPEATTLDTPANISCLRDPDHRLAIQDLRALPAADTAESVSVESPWRTLDGANINFLYDDATY